MWLITREIGHLYTWKVFGDVGAVLQKNWRPYLTASVLEVNSLIIYVIHVN